MVLREWLLSECEFCEALMVLVLHTVLVWWRRLAGKNNLIWALIHDMQMIRLWLANSTGRHSNKTNSTSRETQREGEGERERDIGRAREREPPGSLGVSDWLNRMKHRGWSGALELPRRTGCRARPYLMSIKLLKSLLCTNTITVY